MLIGHFDNGMFYADEESYGKTQEDYSDLDINTFALIQLLRIIPSPYRGRIYIDHLDTCYRLAIAAQPNLTISYAKWEEMPLAWQNELIELDKKIDRKNGGSILFINSSRTDQQFIDKWRKKNNDVWSRFAQPTPGAKPVAIATGDKVDDGWWNGKKKVFDLEEVMRNALFPGEW
jgi:hypothetical protein